MWTGSLRIQLERRLRGAAQSRGGIERWWQRWRIGGTAGRPEQRGGCVVDPAARSALTLL